VCLILRFNSALAAEAARAKDRLVIQCLILRFNSALAAPQCQRHYAPRPVRCLILRFNSALAA